MSELGQVTGLLLLLGEEDMRGSYYRMGTKDTVEGCLKLPTSALKESIGYLFEEDSPPLWGGRLEWSNGSKVTTLLTRHGDGVRLRLRYITTKRNGEKVESDYPVLMTYTVPNYGGRRWWFICPLSVNGVPCGRRVGKLYGPSWSTWFGCRHCFNLTYLSTRENDLYRAGRKRDRIIKRLKGDSTGIFPRLPWKPPNMHWDTYARLADQFQRYQQAELDALDLRLGIDSTSFDEIVRERMEERAYMRGLEAEQRESARYPTLGEIAKRAGVPVEFAREARRRGLIREDKGRGTRRRRYRRKLSSWLEKLYLLNQNGYSWDDIEAWTRRRWAAGHEDERRWPRGFTEV